MDSDSDDETNEDGKDKENRDTDNQKKEDKEKEAEAEEEVHSVHVMNTPAINKFKNLDLKDNEQTTLDLNADKPDTNVKAPAAAKKDDDDDEEEEEQIVRKKKSKRNFVSDSESDRQILIGWFGILHIYSRNSS